MKKRIRSSVASLVGVGLFLVLSPSLCKECGIPWFSWSSVIGPRNFYFAQRQWLADARTVAAAVRFIYEFNKPGPVLPTEVVDIPHALPMPMRPIHTNLSAASVRAAS